jgi:F0F1-type ATP synthase epsilon subunit
MYVVLEYLTYLAIVAILSGVLFVAAAFLVVTAEGAARLSEASRKAAANATHTITEELSASKLLHHETPEHS